MHANEGSFVMYAKFRPVPLRRTPYIGARFMGGVWSPTSRGRVTYVPVVPKTSFWHQKMRKKFLVTYLKDLSPIGKISVKIYRSKKSAVTHPPP